MLVNSTCKFKASVFCLVKMIVNIFSVMGLILVGDVYFLNPSLYLLLFLSYSIRFTLLIFCFLGYLRKRNSPIKWYLVPPSPPLPTTRSLGSQEKVSVNSSTWEVFFFFFSFLRICRIMYLWASPHLVTNIPNFVFFSFKIMFFQFFHVNRYTYN